MIELAKAASNEVKAIKSAIHHGIQTRSPTISQISQSAPQVANTLGMLHQCDG